MPAHTRTVFDPDTLRLAMDLPNCPGFKDSGGDLAYFESVLRLRDRHRPDWRVFVGPEHLTRQATALGGDGGVNGGANLFPQLFTDLFAAADRKDDAIAERLHERVLVLGGIYRLGEGESAVVQRIKAGLAQMGICSDLCAEPWESLRRGSTRRSAVHSHPRGGIKKPPACRRRKRFLALFAGLCK